MFDCLCLFAFVLVMVVFCVLVLVCGILSLVDLLAGWWGLRGRFGSGVDPVCVFRCCLFVGCSVGSYLVLVLTSVVCYFSGLLASGVLF